MSEEESRSELYAKNQGLFDQTFAQIICKTFVGFERNVFEQLSDNDKSVDSAVDYHAAFKQALEGPEYSLTWYGEEAERVMEAVWEGSLKLPGNPEGYWDDGSPIGDEPTTEEF